MHDAPKHYGWFPVVILCLNHPNTDWDAGIAMDIDIDTDREGEGVVEGRTVIVPDIVGDDNEGMAKLDAEIDIDAEIDVDVDTDGENRDIELVVGDIEWDSDGVAELVDTGSADADGDANN